jgi:protocatechuate 3,4-dioxygenase alpha subunit
MSAPFTPSQTIGPFFHEGLEWALTRRGRDLLDGEWLVGGAVVDGNEQGVPDAMLEVWQKNGFQRVFTDSAGRFAFVVRRDAADAVADVMVFARGLQRALRTRLYPAATVEAARARPELAGLSPDRVATLVPSSPDAARRALDWSIHLQGDQETVFFDLV